MKEFKFRAWDGVTMYDHDSLCHSSISLDKLLNGNFEIMQYVGLKNKDNIEIYEGDILKAVHEIGVIKFGKYTSDDDMFGFYLDSNVGCFDITTAKIGKIIGNIYENPELLI